MVGRFGIVSNGAPIQEAKIDAARLRQFVDGCAISETVGSQAGPGDFHAAATACSCVLDGAWVIGDSATADIAGAVACGLRSIWISRGRRWSEANYGPDWITDTVSEAVHHLLDAASQPSSA